jgi:uncharacterized membrane protein YccC
MSPHGIVGWTIYVLGALALAALWFIPSPRSGLAGVLLLIVAAFCAYFGIGTWFAPGFAVAGGVCLVVFWFSDPPNRKERG